MAIGRQAQTESSRIRSRPGPPAGFLPPNDPAHGSPTQPHLCLLGLETGDLYLQDLAKT